MKITKTVSAAAEEMNVGDIIGFTLQSGEEVEAMVMERAGDLATMLFVDCLKTEYAMNERNKNKGGYAESDLRRKLQEIVKGFPEDIKNAIEPFEDGDFLRLATEREVFGENIYGEKEPESVQQWEPMKKRRNRITFQGLNGAWEIWWLQNKAVQSSTNFCRVHSNGLASGWGASSSIGVRPAFRIRLSEIRQA